MGKAAIFGLVLLGVILTSRASPLSKQDSENCGMAQFECDVVMTMGQQPKADGKPNLQRGKISFDATNKRMKFVTTQTDFDGKETNYEIFMKPEEMHIFSPKEGWCVKAQRPTRIDNCAPEGADVTGMRKYGSEKAPLETLVIKYRIVVPGVSNLRHEMVVSNQDKSYAPITEVVMGKMRGEPYLRSEQLYDVTEGIKDSSIFDLPTACMNAPETQNEHFIRQITDRVPFQ